MEQSQQGLLAQQPGLQPQNSSGGELSSDQLSRFKQIFQMGFTYLDKGDNYAVLMEHAKSNPKAAVTTFVAKLTGEIIKKTGETDIMVLMSAMLAVMSNVVDELREKGFQISDDDIIEIINNSIQQVLADNPDFAQVVQNDPDVMSQMQQPPPGV